MGASGEGSPAPKMICVPRSPGMKADVFGWGGMMGQQNRNMEGTQVLMSLSC